MTKEDTGETPSGNKTAPVGLTRRNTLRAVGGTAVAGLGTAALTGSAGAESNDITEIVFCGCSQVCWCIEFCTVAEIITEDGTIAFSDGETEPTLDNYVGYQTEGCYEVDGRVDGDKILAVTVHETDGSGNIIGETTYCNPHRCAERDLESLDISCDEWGEMARDVPGGCGEPPCEHPARGGDHESDTTCDV